MVALAERYPETALALALDVTDAQQRANAVSPVERVTGREMKAEGCVAERAALRT
jgi:hypothetical protein